MHVHIRYVASNLGDNNTLFGKPQTTGLVPHILPHTQVATLGGNLCIAARTGDATGGSIILGGVGDGENGGRRGNTGRDRFGIRTYMPQCPTTIPAYINTQ